MAGFAVLEIAFFFISRNIQILHNKKLPEDSGSHSNLSDIYYGIAAGRKNKPFNKPEYIVSKMSAK